MIKPDIMKNFLLHEEGLIRRFAASYFSDGKIYDEEISSMMKMNVSNFMQLGSSDL